MALEYHYVLPPNGPADAAAVREMFDDVKAYVDTLAPISGAAPSNGSYVTISAEAGLSAERVLTGTANQVIVTDNGAGSTVVLSLPQSIANTSSPSFAGVKLRNGSGNIVTINPKSSFSDYTLTMPADDGSSGQFLQTDGSGVLSWQNVTTGVTDIHGTALQIFVSSTTGSVTLSLPQDISTASSPTFSELLLSGGTSSADLTIKLHDSHTGFYADGVGGLTVVVGNGSNIVVGSWSSSDQSYNSVGPLAAEKHVFRSPSVPAGHPTVTVQPQSSFTSYTLTLPADDGNANQYLTTDGSGNLSWSNAAGTGTVDTGTANRLAYYPASTAEVAALGAITGNRAVVSNSSGLPIAATTTDTEIGYVNGVTSAIQTQLNAKATDSLVVHLAGTENITGTKTFTVQTLFTGVTATPLLIQPASGTTGQGIQIKNPASSGKFNFYIGSQFNLNNVLEFTPSTAADGATYSTPALAINSAGLVAVNATPGTYFFKVKGGNTNNMAIDNDGSQYTELDFLNNGTNKFPMYWDNTNSDFRMGSGTGTITLANLIKITTSATGTTTALLSTANSPAITGTAPYVWLKFLAPDGSTVYIPAWK